LAAVSEPISRSWTMIQRSHPWRSFVRSCRAAWPCGLLPFVVPLLPDRAVPALPRLSRSEDGGRDEGLRVKTLLSSQSGASVSALEAREVGEEPLGVLCGRSRRRRCGREHQKPGVHLGVEHLDPRRPACSRLDERVENGRNSLSKRPGCLVFLSSPVIPRLGPAARPPNIRASPKAARRDVFLIVLIVSSARRAARPRPGCPVRP
jgi:hypothetical protein